MAHLNIISSSKQPWNDVETDLVGIGIFDDHSLTEVGKTIDKSLNGQITKALELGGIKGKSGETTLFYGQDRRILVVGLGNKDEFDTESIRCVGGTVAKFALSKKIAKLAVEVFGNDNSASNCQALAEGLILGSYQFIDYKTKDDDLFELISAVVLNGSETGLNKGSLIANGVCYARDLDNHPGNVTTPSRLAEAAQEIAEEGGMQLTVFDREKFTAMGMGAFAGVASGTDEPPKFIILEYSGAGEEEKPIALAGKGLTFDSGGISIKPSAKMDEMKFDMCGAGVVLGVMKTVALLKPQVNIVAVIASTENLSGAKAYKPGDILTAYNGKTIEVLNTDAEGRLILADALSYVSKHVDPAYILDFATLTGAAVIALGHIATAILGTDEDLIKRVKRSSETTAEKVWELPLWDEYCKHVESKVADVKNVGETRQAGTIAGGAFLKEFVKEGIPWVHFDIAGTAYGGKEKPYTIKKSATGAVIRLVLDLMGV